tara:strand:- start:224 stop:514 length:291 start_codon:yes stop_codon:yes gene_type:complete
MKNFVISYDLNGPNPTHAKMDAHLKACPFCVNYGRLLETVWYFRGNTSTNDLFNYVSKILSQNDRLLVVEGAEATFNNLLIDDQAIVNAWNNRRAA